MYQLRHCNENGNQSHVVYPRFPKRAANSTCCLTVLTYDERFQCRCGGFLYNIVPHTAGRTSSAKVWLVETIALHESFTRSSPCAFRHDSGSSWSGLKSSKNKKTNVEMKQQSRKTYKQTTNLPGTKKLEDICSCHYSFNLTEGRHHLENQFQCQRLKSVSDKWYKQPKIHPPKTNGWNLKKRRNFYNVHQFLGSKPFVFGIVSPHSTLRILPPPRLCVKIKAQPTNQPYTGHFPPKNPEKIRWLFQPANCCFPSVLVSH